MRKTHFRVGISFPVRFFAFIKMEIQANYVTNGKFQGMLEVRPMEMILNNPDGFVQLAEKNTNIFGQFLFAYYTIDMYVL